MDVAVAEFRIDLTEHLNHLPSLHFCGLRIQGTVRLMAVVAAALILYSQSDRVGLHLRHQILRRQYLEIFGRIFAAFSLRVHGCLGRHDDSEGGDRG